MEKAMWSLLRDRRLRGIKFRRQFPIGTFVADFCCYDLKLVIEVDGGVHETAPQMASDENRDIYLQARGYTILRFSNQRVLEEPSGVLDEILDAAWKRGWVP
jgi:uroporphyrinogen-III synthase